MYVPSRTNGNENAVFQHEDEGAPDIVAGEDDENVVEEDQADTDEEVGSVGVALGEVHGEMAAVSAAASSETGDESGIGMAAASATASSSGGVADENNPLRTQYGGARRRDDSDSDSNSRYGGPDDGDGGGKPKAKKIRGNK